MFTMCGVWWQVRIQTNATDGDWSVDKVYPGVNSIFLLAGDAPEAGGSYFPKFEIHAGSPVFNVRKGVQYVIMQREFKTVFKYVILSGIQVWPAIPVFDVVSTMQHIWGRVALI